MRRMTAKWQQNKDKAQSAPLCSSEKTLFSVAPPSPFPLAERGTSSGDEAAVILVLFGVVLQQGVLVPVQVVHQVAIATVLRHQVQGACVVGEYKTDFNEYFQGSLSL